MDHTHVIFCSNLHQVSGPTDRTYGFLAGFDIDQRPQLVPDPAYAVPIDDFEDAVLDSQSLTRMYPLCLAWVFETSRTGLTSNRQDSALLEQYRLHITHLDRMYANVQIHATTEMTRIREQMQKTQEELASIIRQRKGDDQ